MITGKTIHPLGKHGKLILKLGKQKQVLYLHLAAQKSLLLRTEGLSEQVGQSCSNWEGRLEPENMGEIGLFLNTLLELRINISHHSSAGYWQSVLPNSASTPASDMALPCLTELESKEPPCPSLESSPRHGVFFHCPESQYLFWLPGFLPHCFKHKQSVGQRHGKLQGVSECLCGKWTNS